MFDCKNHSLSNLHGDLQTFIIKTQTPLLS